MIEYDYTLVRDEEDETKTYKPDKIPTQLDNLVYIEGPNSCGKSTLLHILALSLYGQKNNSIHPSLRDKINNLMDSNYQKLTFSVKITDKNNSLQIISEKKYPDKPEIKVYEKVNGKKQLLSPNLFERKYALIYDIPVDPTQRLNQLTQDIKYAQIRYGNKVGELKEFIRKTIIDIHQSKDPKTIDQLGEDIKKLNKDIEISRETKRKLEKTQDIIESYFYLRYYDIYKTAVETLEKEFKKLKRKEGNIVKDIKKIDKTFDQLKLRCLVAIREMDETFNKATSYLRNLIPKDEQHHLRIWERISLSDALENFEFDVNLEREIIEFKSILSELHNKNYSEDMKRKAEFYKDLIELFERFKDLDIVLPGEKTIGEFIETLRAEIKKYEPVIRSHQNFEEADALLDKLKEQARNIENNFLSELRELKNKKPELGETLENGLLGQRISDLERKLKDKKEKLEYYEKGWSKKGKPSWEDLNEVNNKLLWREYTSYTEKQLKDELIEIQNQILEEEKTLRDYEYRLKRKMETLESLKKKKEHPYHKYLDQLENIFYAATESLEQKLKYTFNEYLIDIINKKAKHSSNKEQEAYYEAVFSYLAKKIGFIRHLSEEYKVKYIDLIEQVIITENGKKIHFLDMGTGQSQSAYLVGKLNISENKKIIALFDEVAMMDNKSLDRIYQKFNELYDEDRLLVGIVVQKADKINVVSKVRGE